MDNPSISVVLPLYNHAQYIEKTLQSVLRQTSPVDEIILIDDGSTDNGFNIAENILKDDSRARMFKQENCGADKALNRGIDLSQCEFIAVLNTDDMFVPTKIERCRNIISNNPAIDFISGGIGVITEKGDGLSSGETVEWLLRATDFQKKCRTLDLAFLNENYVTSTSNMVFSRELWRNCHGFQPLRYCHDLDFLLTALCHHGVMIDMEQTHILYRVHKNNTIKENISKIRLEIAAVMANAMISNSNRLIDFEHLSSDILMMSEILKSKNNAALLCTLQILRKNCSNREDFYMLLNNKTTADNLIRFFL
jgi:glycosyltransferase involved in cell wall biosynthesis